MVKFLSDDSTYVVVGVCSFHVQVMFVALDVFVVVLSFGKLVLTYINFESFRHNQEVLL